MKLDENVEIIDLDAGVVRQSNANNVNVSVQENVTLDYLNVNDYPIKENFVVNDYPV